MNPQLQSILEKIKQEAGLSEQEKEYYANAIKDIDKKQNLLSFKVERIEKDRHTLTIMLEESIEDLQKKSKQIEDSNAALQLKNHELEIETSLERVRASAMAMKEPADMLDICKTISLQLALLGIKEIRNVQTAIFYEEKGTYFNYEYYAKHDKTFITETDYTNHEVHKAFAQQMLKGVNEFYIHSFKKDELKSWYEYQKTTNVFIDDYILTADSLTYYWYSLGPVALGISTYMPLTEDEQNLFKRFLKVFELSYRRYLDIEKAERQAREARIQASLERMRAVAMAMHISEDLLNVCEVMYNEFLTLGFTKIRNAMINIHNDAEKTFINYDYSNEIGRSTNHLTYNIHRLVEIQIGKIRSSNDAFSETYFTGDDLEEWKKFRKKIGEKDDPRMDKNNGLYYYFYSIGIGSVGISTFGPLNEEKNELLKRFRNVFALSYQRYIDIANAEAQAREAQIELSLERVRAKTMAMHNSADVGESAAAMVDELKKLGIETMRCGIGIMHEPGNMELWTIRKDEKNKTDIIIGLMDMHMHPLLEGAFESWRNKIETYSYELRDEDLYNYYDAINNYPDYPIRYAISDLPKLIYHNEFHFAEGTLFSFSLQQLTDEQRKIFKRFANVFGQTYRRYLDLKKAEAQAREAQIEAALERVRSRSIGMQKSDELQEVIQIVYEQFVHLNIKLDHAGFVVDYKPKGDWHFWIADKQEIPSKITVPYFDSVWANQFNEAKEKGKDFFVTHLNFEEKNKFYKELLSYVPDLSEEVKQFYFSVPGLAASTALSENVSLYIENFSATPYSDEENAVLMRFGKVFEQTYTRFLDLQKAEMQAREAQIEVSLERVRSHAMAMHSSEDVLLTTTVVFSELKKLGIESLRCGIILLSKDSRSAKIYASATSSNGELRTLYLLTEMTDHPLQERQYQSWLTQENYFTELKGKELQAYYQLPLFHSSPNYNPPATYEQSEFGYYIPFAEGLFYAWAAEAYSENEINVLNRFKTILGLTFRRYLDLQKAETQTREAQIEASLERVRSHAMAMHNSGDLAATANLVFVELKKLGIQQIRSGVGLIDKNTRNMEVYSATSSGNGSLALMGLLKLSGHPVFESQFESWLNHENYFASLRNDELTSYYKIISAGLGTSLNTSGAENEEYGHWIMFSEGFLYAWSEKRYSDEEIKILERFKNVIELTFKRYSDLKKAEASAKEAIKQAALDRIRADIASMRTISDLDRITPLIWNELTVLGIPFLRCGVFIMDDEQQQIHTFLSTPEGKAIAAFHLPYNTSGNFSEIVSHWHQKKIYINHWNQKDFSGLADTLIEQGAVQSREQYLGSIPDDGIHLHLLPFIQGMLYVGNNSKLKEDEIELIQSVADAFSTAYARYEDFNKLEAAKKQVDSALNELQATQKQLVQSEKMASLGELTAGIAHEIQNPLNFVNNFSEVSNELIDELNAERAKPNAQRDEEMENEILNDIKQNLEKINHHGKRADAIVKGMLQHSRSSTGTKELTDINALCDEYLRLAYHGLRAKDKSFNAKFEADFETTIPKLNVVPQDIGRVLLNLVNNAFYAVNEKQKQIAGGPAGPGSYQPTVIISTKKSENRISITVSDNGGGIPQNIIDKIFQPFFTTKPTGSGTGLGLSLAYDIIKAHTGEIKVETKENEGTIFMIQLPIA